MKKLLFLVLLLSNFLSFAQYTLIPDVNFEKALIEKGFDSGAIDGKVLTANISGVSVLSVHDLNISNLTGIQDFVSLIYLSCGGNPFTTLDISKNTALEEFGCIGSQLTTIDFSKNTSLTKISLYNSKLTSIDVSKNIKLNFLLCSNNSITTANLKNGNNINLYLDLAQNPNLGCVEVDDKAFSDRNWSTKVNATARFSENCSKTAAIAPPVIIATGDQIYCPNTSIKITTGVTITHDPLELGTKSVTIQISSGYVFGQDKLDLTGSHPTITSSWSPLEGKLTLNSSSSSGTTVSYTDFEAAIKDITFTNSSLSPSGTRDFSINLGIGSANYLPRNGHFYEYIPSIGITWTAAKALAEAPASNYYGLQGYLATLTAADETQLAGAQAPGAGWIGGSDAQTEGAWKWVTGPEGLANGGTGTPFWNGLSNGFTTPPFNFAFWNTGEPNNCCSGENYAHITAKEVGKPGSWNDLSNTSNSSGDYQAKGYVVEYGGMPGELPLEISASTKITIPKITNTTPSAPICGSGIVTLGATATDGTVNWYNSSSGGTPLATGNTFTTPNLTTSTIYYVDANPGCNAPRTQITATVNPLPNLPVNNSLVFYCQNETAIPLVATASANCTLNWYNSPTGGSSTSTSPIPLTTIVGSTSYFVSQTITATGCESPRAEIIVTVNPLPLAPGVNKVNYCQNENPLPLTATASPNCTLNWYTSASGGLPSPSSPTTSTAMLGSANYYVSQTITATGCEGPRAQIIVTINPIPLAPRINNVSQCHNDTLTPLPAIAATGCVLNWYTTAIGGSSSLVSPMPSTASVGSKSYFVSQTISSTGCEGPRAEIIVTTNPLPVVKDITITQCDTDLISDGKTLFNLTVNNDVISLNYINENFTYYTTLNGANNAIPADLIANDLAFENTISTKMDIWSRVTNKASGCSSVAKITLKVPSTNISPSNKVPFDPVCDDFLDSNGNNTTNNNNRDGITTFDFSSTKAIILAPLPTTDVYNIYYYKNESDALAELNVISNISNYRNIGFPYSQDIWVRIESSLDNTCVGIGPYITLKVEALPIANTVTIPRQCDDNQDGIFTFNTSFLEITLLNGQKNKTVTYFDQTNAPLKDAKGVLITSPFPINFTSTSQTIKAVVTNNTPQQCFDETFITFIVDKSPEAFAVSSSLTTKCDDEPNPLNQDGKFAFDTSTFENIILGGQTGMIVKYYDSNKVLLPSPLPNPFVTKTQNITVTVENFSNKNCAATTTLNFVVNPIPNIDLNVDGKADKLVCSNLPTFFVTLDAGITDNSPTSNYNYVWKKDGINLNTNAPTLGVNNEGVYTIEVINNSGCSRIRTIEVKASNVATIDSIDIVDLSDVNSVTVNVSGPGEYEYSLDDSNNFWQDSNFFDNVPAGIHEVFINDKNGCGIVSKEIVVVGIPKYFTPNNDSYNDVWGIKGLSKYPAAIVHIFDRYGKLITTLNPVNPTWDGFLNGNPLPADDYWYAITLEKNKPTIRGHFSLKR